MASTKQKYATLNNTSGSEFGFDTTNLLFPLDLLSLEGQDLTCVTFFPNIIKNHGVSISGSKALRKSSSALQSPYGETPIIHTEQNKGSLLRKNGGKELFSNLYSRSGESITMPLPKSLSFNFQVNWMNAELGAGAAAIDQLTDIDKLAGDNGTEYAKRLGMNTIASVIGGMSKGNVKAKELLQLGTASIANNYAETMFKNVSNRVIPFSWVLTPRNEKEARAIDNLLRMFRFHMLPEYNKNIGNGNAYLMYPSSFDIVFWINGAPHPYLPRVGTCALTSMTIDETPNGQYIPMIDGAPQSVKVDLSFLEMQTLSKDNVAKDEMGTTF